MGTITSVQWANSLHLRYSDKNTVLVKEKVVTIDSETSEVLKVVDRFKPVHDPKRTIYITKPQYRCHQFKRDVEDIEKVEKYVIKDRFLEYEIMRILDIKVDEDQKRPTLRDLCDSPYVYHADISLEALIRARYQERQKHDIIPIRVGSFDIETSVLQDDSNGVINCLTFCAEKTIYTAALDGFMWKYVNGKKVKATDNDFKEQIKKDIQPYIDKHGFKIVYKICNSELELLTWIFTQIHKEKVDFIGIWNIGFDIPTVIDRIKHYNKRPEDFFCHPDIEEDLRYCHFKEDKRPAAHIVEKWHWFYCSHYSQWVDDMLLYARIRKAQTKEPSYTLDAISTKEVGEGKIKLEEGSHAEMQQYKFVQYWTYNMVDAILLQLMHWKNGDIQQMMRLTGSSPYPDFSKQTVMLKNIYYKFCLKRGKVFASTGKNMVGPYDKYFSKSGGAVLKASLVQGIGINAIIERPNYESMIVVLGADLDFKAYYPSTESMYGLSKENKIATVIGIEGIADKEDKNKTEKIEAFMGGIAMPQANSVWIGHDYFGLPNYEEWIDIFANEFATPSLRKNSA